MAYTKHDWSAGEIITEANMDHIEQGIQDNSDALSGVSFTRTQATQSGVTFTLPNAYRGIMFTITSNGNSHGLFYVFATNAGAVTVTQVSSDTLITYTAGTNSLSVAYTQSGDIVVAFMNLNGKATIAS